MLLLSILVQHVTTPENTCHYPLWTSYNIQLVAQRISLTKDLSNEPAHQTFCATLDLDRRLPQTRHDHSEPNQQALCTTLDFEIRLTQQRHAHTEPAHLYNKLYRVDWLKKKLWCIFLIFPHKYGTSDCNSSSWLLMASAGRVLTLFFQNILAEAPEELTTNNLFHLSFQS